MSKENLFLDTSFIYALLNLEDEHHRKAKKLEARFKVARKWVTEVVLMELGNAMSGKGQTGRIEAVKFIEKCNRDYDTNVVNVDTALFSRALELYKARPDKSMGLVDCISFVVMRERNLKLALTHDQDFEQEGFQALMREQI